MKLREYQEKIINWLRYWWKKDDSYLIQAPTGAGKTVISSFIVRGLYENGYRILFLVPRTTLINQTIKTFSRFDIDCGVQQADHELTDLTKQVQVGTVQTLARRGYGQYDVIIVDECHIRSNALFRHLEDFQGRAIGLTATPYAHWLGNVYRRFIKCVTLRQLQDLGFLSQYEFYAPCNPDLKGVKTKYSKDFGSDYNDEEVAEIMGDAKIAGNIVTHWLEHGDSLPTIAFCCNVLHANHLCIEFRKAGINAEVVIGNTPDIERDIIFGKFTQGIVKIILSVEVLVEGFDSDVRCIIYAKPTKSEMRWIQSIGRGLRPAEGKTTCKIFDHSGTLFRLGYPHEIEYDELFGDASQYKQAQAQRKKQYEKKEKECPSCKYVKPAGEYICSKCGFKPIYGEDGDVNEDIQLKKIEDKGPTIEEKQQFYSELLGYYEEKINEGKNWKPGWAAHKFKEKFKEWPNGLRKSKSAPSKATVNFIRSRNIAMSHIKKMRDIVNG